MTLSGLPRVVLSNALFGHLSSFILITSSVLVLIIPGYFVQDTVVQLFVLPSFHYPVIRGLTGTKNLSEHPSLQKTGAC